MSDTLIPKKSAQLEGFSEEGEYGWISRAGEHGKPGGEAHSSVLGKVQHEGDLDSQPRSSKPPPLIQQEAALIDLDRELFTASGADLGMDRNRRGVSPSEPWRVHQPRQEPGEVHRSPPLLMSPLASDILLRLLWTVRSLGLEIDPRRELLRWRQRRLLREEGFLPVSQAFPLPVH
jgi:hypothetical protein